MGVLQRSILVRSDGNFYTNKFTMKGIDRCYEKFTYPILFYKYKLSFIYYNGNYLVVYTKKGLDKSLNTKLNVIHQIHSFCGVVSPLSLFYVGTVIIFKEGRFMIGRVGTNRRF